jgi:cyclopropane fatty-acyl-phospholipid synthase-like methyltransferase
MIDVAASAKQYAPSCDRNKDFILAVLKEVLPSSGTVLEIGSGTGQHAVYFASHLPNLVWQPSDLSENHSSIRAWAGEKAPPNLRGPIELDLFNERWPDEFITAIVCINTIHIVAWEGVARLFSKGTQLLPPGGVFYVYGPYRYPDRPLEPSNEDFDRWLKARDPRSGVRDFSAVNALAEQSGLRLVGDRAMPANNRSLWWVKNEAENA